MRRGLSTEPGWWGRRQSEREAEGARDKECDFRRQESESRRVSPRTLSPDPSISCDWNESRKVE